VGRLGAVAGAVLEIVRYSTKIEHQTHEDIKTTVNRYSHLLPSVDAALADAPGEKFEAVEGRVVELRAAPSFVSRS
jgi:hypothetical protein